MQVEITVKVNGREVKKVVEQVEGTLEQMEEKIDAMSRRVACETLQASVEATEAPRPLFQPKAGGSVTGGTEGGRS
jgi:hypothetical protein